MFHQMQKQCFGVLAAAIDIDLRGDGDAGAGPKGFEAGKASKTRSNDGGGDPCAGHVPLHDHWTLDATYVAKDYVKVEKVRGPVKRQWTSVVTSELGVGARQKLGMSFESQTHVKRKWGESCVKEQFTDYSTRPKDIFRAQQRHKMLSALTHTLVDNCYAANEGADSDSDDIVIA